MTTHSALTRSAVALAVLAALGAAQAQAPAADTKPDSEAEAWASVGVGWASGDRDDRAFFGQYNGLRDQSVYGLIDFDYARRREADGTLVSLVGTNLGLQTRELGLLWQRQGDWRFTADYGELIRRDPYTIDTGIAGAGSTAPQVVYLAGGVGSGYDYDPKTKRQSLGLGFSKWFGTELELVAGVKSENKQGSNFWGIGFNCPALAAPGCGPICR